MKKISGPKTGEKFVFVFIDTEEEDVYVFNHWNQIKSRSDKLKVSKKSVLIFLRNGLIYPPYTIYSNVIMLPVGASINVDIKTGKYQWNNDFRYLDKDSKQNSAPDSKALCQYIANSFKHLKNEKRSIYMMQSAGKDSAAMLLGLKMAGVENVKCITYEANYRDRESAPAKIIAEGLGFEHTTIESDFDLEYKLLKEYQGRVLGLTGDFALLPYIRANGSEIEKDSIVIDGLGNDMYMGYVSPKIERLLMAGAMPSLKKFEPKFRFKNEKLSYLLSSAFLEPYERLFPGSRLSVPEIELLTGSTFCDDNSEYFKTLYKSLDKDDFRVAVRSRLCDSSQFQMKGELTCDAAGNEIYFPFSDKELVDYYFNLPLSDRYDKPNAVNKTLLRKMIHEKLDEDEFFKVKSGFRYDMPGFISKNFSKVREDILSCSLFDCNQCESWLSKREGNLKNYVEASKIYILLVFSSWFNAHDFDIDDAHIADQFDWKGIQ